MSQMRDERRTSSEEEWRRACVYPYHQVDVLESQPESDEGILVINNTV